MEGTNVMQITLLIFALVLVVLTIFPLEKNINAFLQVNINKFYYLIFGIATFFLLMFWQIGFIFIIDFALIAFVILVALFGFMSNRTHIYILGIFFLALTTVFLILGINKLAEFSAYLFYLLLILGVLKDFAYNLFFEKE